MSSTTTRRCDFCTKEAPEGEILWSLELRDENHHLFIPRGPSGSFLVDICGPCLVEIATGHGVSEGIFKEMVRDALEKTAERDRSGR